MDKPAGTPKNAVEMQHIVTRFGSHVVHDGIDLAVRRGEIFAVIGGSGSGKSTLLREMILLHTPDEGSIRILGTELTNITSDTAMALRLRFGVLFQHGGLFGSMSVLANIGLPLREHRETIVIAASCLALSKVLSEVLAVAVHPR